MTSGQVFEYSERRGVRTMPITAAIRPGASGGAVLDARGRLVGIATARDPDRPAGNLAISVEELLAFAYRKGFLSRADYRQYREQFEAAYRVPEAATSQAPQARQGVQEGNQPSPAYRFGKAMRKSLATGLIVFLLVFGAGRLWMGPKRPPYAFTLSFFATWAVAAVGRFHAQPIPPKESAAGAEFWPAFGVAVATMLLIGSRSGEDSAASGNPRGTVGESSAPEGEGQEEQAEGESPDPPPAGSTTCEARIDHVRGTREAPNSPGLRYVARPDPPEGFVVRDQMTGGIEAFPETQEEAVQEASRLNSLREERAGDSTEESPRYVA